MVRRRLLLLALALGAASFGALAFGQPMSFGALRASIAADHPRVPFITVPELAQQLRRRTGGRPLLLDARTEAEFRVSHLPRARRIDPDRPDLTLAGSNRGRAIVVYCSVGVRSASVADRLLAAGYPSVRNLEGGIFQWANTGNPVVRGDATVLEVHPYDAVWGTLLRSDLHALTPGASRR